MEIDDRRNLHTEYPNQYQKDAQANVQKSLFKEYSELNTHSVFVTMKQDTAQQVMGGGDVAVSTDETNTPSTPISIKKTLRRMFRNHSWKSTLN